MGPVTRVIIERLSLVGDASGWDVWEHTGWV